VIRAVRSHCLPSHFLVTRSKADLILSFSGTAHFAYHFHKPSRKSKKALLADMHLRPGQHISNFIMLSAVDFCFFWSSKRKGAIKVRRRPFGFSSPSGHKAPGYDDQL
jgi:hypothetical protein